MLWYIKQDGTPAKTTEPELIQVERLFQELLLWKGENPMNINLGIDYMGVFENRVFLKSSVEDVCNKYANYFNGISVGDPVYSSNGELMSLDVSVTLLDESVIRRNLIDLL